MINFLSLHLDEISSSISPPATSQLRWVQGYNVDTSFSSEYLAISHFAVGAGAKLVRDLEQGNFRQYRR